jgi:ligand-binding sensor domain-containing protein
LGPRARRGRRFLAVAFAAFLGAGLTATSAAAPAFPTAAAALAAAQSSCREGEPGAALETLRKLRSDHPDSPLVAESFLLSVSCSLALGDDFRARYFLQRVRDAAPRSLAAFRAGMLVAARCYATRSWLAALEYYRGAVEGWGDDSAPGREELDLALLRAAELALYHGSDAREARGYFPRIVAANLPASERIHYRELRVRLLWKVIPPEVFGLSDANVSSLRVDGDDLWVGTWNGGVARYSVSAMHSDPFPGPAYSRSIEVADHRVWVGTSEGLAWYGKASGRWGSEPDFQSPAPHRVQVVRLAGGVLYAGTLGDGLYRQELDGWSEVSDGDLPGRFITCIAPDPSGKRLFIGTMNLGLVILDLGTGQMGTLSEIADAFTADNITTVLPDAEGRVWIGTYGEGLYLWKPEGNTLSRYSRATGQIGDDWILAGCETDRALYFGSFGGGVSVYEKGSGLWRRLGISDGLASIDVPAIAWRAPYVFFGTLGAGVGMYEEGADVAQP